MAEAVVTHNKEHDDLSEDAENAVNQDEVKEDEAGRKASPHRARRAQRTKRAQVIVPNADKSDKLGHNKPDDDLDVDEAGYSEEDDEPDEPSKILTGLCFLGEGMLCCLKSFLHSVLKICQSAKKHLTHLFGFILLLASVYLLSNYVVNPTQESDFPDFNAKIIFTIRSMALFLIPSVVAMTTRFLTGRAKNMMDFQRASVPDTVMLMLNVAVLTTHLEASRFHFLWVLLVTLTTFSFLHWMSVVCFGLETQKFFHQPIFLCNLLLAIYNTVVIVGQDGGCLSRTDHLQDTTDSSIDQGWRYPSMCDVIEKAFCGLEKPRSGW